LYNPFLTMEFTTSMLESPLDSDQPQVSRAVPSPSVDTFDSMSCVSKSPSRWFPRRSLHPMRSPEGFSASHLPRRQREFSFVPLVNGSPLSSEIYYSFLKLLNSPQSLSNRILNESVSLPISSLGEGKIQELFIKSRTKGRRGRLEKCATPNGVIEPSRLDRNTTSRSNRGAFSTKQKLFTSGNRDRVGCLLSDQSREPIPIVESHFNDLNIASVGDIPDEWTSSPMMNSR